MTTIWELREGNGDLTEPIGLSLEQCDKLVRAGLIRAVQTVHQFDLDGRASLDDVLERI